MSEWNGNTATAEREDVQEAALVARTGDAEVDALATITRTLSGLDEDAVARVMAFANARFCGGTAAPAQAKRGK